VSPERVSSGSPPSTVRLLIVDPLTGEPVADGAEGEVWIQGPSVAKGYWRNAEATEATFGARVRGDEGGGSWLRTGDLARFVENQLYVTGRIKDVVIVGGRQIYPQDVEEFVQSLDKRLKLGAGIAFGLEAADGEVLGLAQETVLMPQTEQRALVGRIRAEVFEAFRVRLHTVLLLKAGGIPKTFNGKLRRSACREAVERGELPILYESSVGEIGGIS
jgi:acyl-CoA synthetase (AMP-forming)/AMP-acid ligase II